jgi:hypothetical protein
MLQRQSNALGEGYVPCGTPAEVEARGRDKVRGFICANASARGDRGIVGNGAALGRTTRL